MKTAYVLQEMQESFRTADIRFRQENYKDSVEFYQKALHLCESLPSETEFDRRRFEASCYAGLSGALGRSGKHLESFAAANKALVFYDSCGDKYPADIGRWLMAQVNQATSLATLNCFSAAIEALQRAKDMFVAKCLDPVKNAEWIKMVDKNIEAINAQIKKTQC